MDLVELLNKAVELKASDFFLGIGDTPQLHAPDFTFDDEAVLPRGVEFLKKLLMLP